MNDVCVLELLVIDLLDFLLLFCEFCYFLMDLFLIFIGYGYLGYNFKIFELKVKVFDWKLRWVENFVVWICNNCV